MATADSVKSKLQGLIDQANATTGNTDADLTSAIASLISGFGQGGDVGGLAYDMGEFVFDADVQSMEIPHNLEDIPDFILVWTDDFSGLSAENLSTQQCNIGYCWFRGLTGLKARFTSTTTGSYGAFFNFNLPVDEYRLVSGMPSSASYSPKVPTEQYLFCHKMSASSYWRAGVTYKYFVSKAWWNVRGVASD